MPDPRLDLVLEGKCYEGYYWITWQNGNVDGRLDKIIASMLNLLTFITILTLW